MASRLFFLVFLLSGLLAARPAAAQSSAFGFELRPVAKVVQGSDTLRQAWAGGLDSPQFSSIELNGDGQPDLFIYDRRTRRVLTYLSAAAPSGGRQWQYAPDYEVLFPVGMHNWALLRDYDCDGRPDLFTNGTSEVDIQVYRNVAGTNGLPMFQLATPLVTALVGTNQTNINTGDNLPTIEDIDGDGRLDILIYDWENNKFVVHYRNTSTGACGGLQFRLASESWGNIQSCLGTCGAYSFSPTTLCRPADVQHTSASNVLALDLDADGDKDLLVARDYCPELTAFTNEGTPQQERMTAAGLNNSFPTGTTPVRLPNFPSAYHLDVNFDGRPDLLAASAVFDNLDSLETRRSVWFYENAGTGAAPNFQFRQPDFLQRDMLEASSLAAPAFLDVDADGLKDLLVAGTRRDAPGGFFVASVAYYRNVGTAARAVYRLVTTDYLNLSGKKFARLQPVIVDLNRDGAPDLACIGYSAMGQRSGFLGFYLNQAAAGRAPSFNTATMRYISNVPNAQFDNAAFFDIDNDGYVDLLYGTNANRPDLPGQSLRYYRNTGGSTLETAFVVANADYGQIRSAGNARPVNLCPLVADFDGDGTPDLLTVDASGTVRLFRDLRAQSSIFLDRTNLFYNATRGTYDNAQLGTYDQNHTTLAATDVNGDGGLELFIGLESGGVLAAAPRNRVLSTRGAARNLPLTLYPNPAAATATLEAARPVRLTLLDLTGRTVRSSSTPARRHTLDLRGLAVGLYLVRCETSDGQSGVQRLVVK